MGVTYNKENLEQKIKNFSLGKAKNLHILADFDKTLTQSGIINGKKISSIIGQLRADGYLSQNYVDESFALYNHYGPLEHDQSISRPERLRIMEEWWIKHIELLIKSRLNKRDMDHVVAKNHIKLRPGVSEFLKLLEKFGVPIVIMSGAPAYMIQKQLELAGLMTENVHIVANWYKYDTEGYMIGYKTPIIHSLNKYEITIREFPFFEQLKERKNVMLLGDQIDDLGMIEGFDYDNLLTIGFANEKEDEEKYSKKFDILITENDNFNFINEITKKIL
ncbi:MAG: hypothetical protein A2537_00340 [Candidatus Magasanikbacteria bacterium RIFOXYD2_FULL_36_9]|uniref:5'-nucleotidase n=1 Tax=Candidatus Magasanikbacteria bacterium RIFOXYD2_FULL_36_9 TaxID=1798707 RepID=A0A1F6NYW6_9BACT|nr:MAG: hypothetical protein A2537_00340 [Candidatus Magasanikbacteria bacterium RIFOXYD2_FULL_36_9]